MDIKKRANFIIAAMPQFEKTSEDDLRVLLPQRWKELHQKPSWQLRYDNSQSDASNK